MASWADLVAAAFDSMRRRGVNVIRWSKGEKGLLLVDVLPPPIEYIIFV